MPSTNGVVRIDRLPITPENMFYWYKATMIRVIDGDSYVLYMDFGCKIKRDDYHCRGWGLPYDKKADVYYDTWETRRRPSGLTDEEWEEHKRKGKEATEFMNKIACAGSEMTVLTHRDGEGKYGRLLVHPYVKSGDGWIDIRASLEKNGFMKEH